MNPLWQNIFRIRANEQSLAYFLGTVAAFNKLEKRELSLLESIIHLRNYNTEEMVFNQADIGSGMYIIRSGQIQIYSHDEHNNKLDHATLKAGDFFGEIALTASRPRSASAQATEPTILAGLFRSDLEEAMRRHPETTAKILFGLNRVICDRLLQCNLHLQDLKRKASEPQETSTDE